MVQKIRWWLIRRLAGRDTIVLNTHVRGGIDVTPVGLVADSQFTPSEADLPAIRGRV